MTMTMMLRSLLVVLTTTAPAVNSWTVSPPASATKHRRVGLQAKISSTAELQDAACRRSFLSHCATAAATAVTFLPSLAYATDEDNSTVAAAVEEQKEKVTTLLQKDESDETKVEQETEALISKLEASPEDTATAQKLIRQLEQDEEMVEQETEQLIQQLETLEAAAETANVAILEEPAAKTPEAAAEASAVETKEFIATLQDRSATTDTYITELKQQVGAAKTSTMSSDFLRVLKDRVAANGDFLAKYDDFVARWKSR